MVIMLRLAARTRQRLALKIIMGRGSREISRARWQRGCDRLSISPHFPWTRGSARSCLGKKTGTLNGREFNRTQCLFS